MTHRDAEPSRTAAFQPRTTWRSPSFWSVIPAGGSGTRLWPLSRSVRPKFLLPLLGDRSLLQQTVDRLLPFSSPERTLVICGTAHAAAVARQVPELPDQNVIVEPSPKGSGPAIALAAAIIAKIDPNAVMGSFAADHEVRIHEGFVAAVRTAIATAAAGDWLVTIGLTPDRPETGYGYVERSDEAVAVTPTGTAYRAVRFVEKPDLATATEYVESGHFLWNASMFIWRAQTLLDSLAVLQPDLLKAITRIADCWGTSEQEMVVAEVWPTIEESTIDQGVMERANNVAVVPAEIGWSDVGDWHGLGELVEHDSAKNSLHGDVTPIDCERCVLWSDSGRMIVTIGLENTIVVETHDTVLVANRSRAQEVRRIVKELHSIGRHDLT
jgi:mannose-1-phosphate guanylyltransferase